MNTFKIFRYVFMRQDNVDMQLNYLIDIRRHNDVDIGLCTYRSVVSTCEKFNLSSCNTYISRRHNYFSCISISAYWYSFCLLYVYCQKLALVCEFSHFQPIFVMSMLAYILTLHGDIKLFCKWWHLSNGLFFFERWSLITATVCANKFS